MKDVRKLITKVNFPNFHQNFDVIFRSHCDVTMLGYNNVIGNLHLPTTSQFGSD